MWGEVGRLAANEPVLVVVRLARVVDEDVVLVNGALDETTRLVEEALEVVAHQDLLLLLLRQLGHCARAPTPYNNMCTSSHAHLTT